MRYKVFVDTNILLSGIFFEGNESRILDLVELDIVTSEDVVDELRKVVQRKLKYLKERTFEIAIAETEKALTDISIIPRSKYSHKLKEAEGLITIKKISLSSLQSSMRSLTIFLPAMLIFLPIR